MPFIVENDFVPPPEGTHPTVICDVEDLGIQQTAFGPKHRCISFQLTELAQLKKNQRRHQRNYRVPADTKRIAREVSQLIRQAMAQPTRARAKRHS